jgi:CheY-like chemotaxis protein
LNAFLVERFVRTRPTSLNVLIVEDEALIALDIRMMLEELGYRILGVAFSGTDSLAKAEALRPDVVLMDVKLKGEMDGVTAAEAIHRRFGIPVVYLTAYTDPQTLGRLRGSGPFGCLHKPFEPDELRDAIAATAAAFPAWDATGRSC